MGTATRVPETTTISGDELSADDAVTTLRRYGRWNLVKNSFIRFRYADGFTNARALALQFCLSRALPIIRTTGSSTVSNVTPNLGRRHPCSVVSRRTSPAGAGPERRRRTCPVPAAPPNARASLPNSGPATITVGIATATPSASVMPRLAFKLEIATNGPADNPASAGMPTVISDCCERRATR